MRYTVKITENGIQEVYYKGERLPDVIGTIVEQDAYDHLASSKKRENYGTVSIKVMAKLEK